MSYIIRLNTLKLVLILELNLIPVGYYSLRWCKELNRFLNLVTVRGLLLISLNDSKNQLLIDVGEVHRQPILLFSSLLNHLSQLWFKLRIGIDRFEVREPTWLIHHTRLVVNLKRSPIALSSFLMAMVHLALAWVMIQCDSNIRIESLAYRDRVLQDGVIAIGLRDEMI